MSLNADPTNLSPRPIPGNSISVPSHTSHIARAQARVKMAELTNYEMRETPPGEFTLFNKTDASNKRPLCNIKFELDQNGNRTMMTAHFTQPINTQAIKAIALFSAHSQANTFIVYSKTPSGTNFNFTEDSKNPGLNAQADNAFKIEYDSVYTTQKMPIVGPAIVGENTAIRHDKSVFASLKT